MTLDVKTWILSHCIWIVAVAVALTMGHAWLREHDQRLAVESSLKSSQAQIQTLQQQITTAQQQAQIKVQTVTKIVHDTTTTTQAVKAIPQVTDVPLNTRQAVDNPLQVSVDALPLVSDLGELQTDKAQLSACQITVTADAGIIKQKNDQIVLLKKKPPFLKRVENRLREFGEDAAIVGIVALMVKK
jgi:hypothetical protein